MRIRIVASLVVPVLLLLCGCQPGRRAQESVTQREVKPSKSDDLEPSIVLLAPEVLKQTPEYVHFVEGTTFSWVLLQLEPGAVPPDLASEVKDLLAEKYQLLTTRDELTQDHLIERQLADGSSEFLGYRDGFLFSFTVNIIESGLVEIEYSDYESPLAASWHTVLYRWVNGRWVGSPKGPMVVS